MTSRNDIICWLNSDDGLEWSLRRHRQSTANAGVFASIKEDKAKCGIPERCSVHCPEGTLAFVKILSDVSFRRHWHSVSCACALCIREDTTLSY